MIKISKAFQETLNSLNEEQKAAVEGIHGPWLVLAGPGTGKTHMLAARIGNIMLKEQVEPRNILCLTFTNAGVKAMRDRLVRFMGAPGSRVAVHTFHDFARTVIEEFPALFDYVEWEAMDDLDQRRIINGVIDQLPPKHAMRGPVHEPYANAKDLLWLFQEMAKESWSPEDVVAAAKTHIDELPTLKEYVYQTNRKGQWEKGDLKPDAKTQTERMERLMAATELFYPYAEAKRKRALYDYADQIGWLRDALRDHEDLRLQLQERYQYLLVDEYQDTNGIQNEILTLLAEEENPNLFVVGDDDQSIYGFQGARIEGLREFVDRYRQDLRVVVLRENYRSHQGILDAAQLVIGENQNRLGSVAGFELEKTLTEGARFAERPTPKVINYPGELAQAHYVTEQIKTWIADGTPADEIGVIYRKHSQAARLIEALEREKVPYRLQRSINVLEQPLVRRLHSILGFIANLRSDKPIDEQQAFEFMESPAIGVQTTELLAINGYKFIHNSRVPSWRFLLMNPQVLADENVPITNPERFQKAADLLNELGELLEKYPLPYVIQQVAQRSGLLREALATDERELALECLDAIVRDAHARVRKHPSLTLEELCSTWDEMIAYDMPLSLIKQADTRQAVSLMTAHSAKGLEFDRVVMYDVTRQAWESNRKLGIGFTLPPQLSRELGKEAKEEENRRLFYVALTRARKELILTVPAESETGRQLSAAVAIESMVDENLAIRVEAEVNDEDLYAGLEQHYLQGKKPSPTPLDPKVARQRWEDSDLTLGALTQFDRCRVGFYYQYVSDSPRTPRAVDRFRKTVHGTMHEFYRRAKHPDVLEFMSEEELIALYHDNLNRERSGLLPKEYEKYLEDGELMLRDWYNSAEDQKSINSKIESGFELTTPAGLRLKGRIDRVDIDAQTQLGIPVDYKLGEPRELKVYTNTKGARPHMTDSRWRQLAYYAILLRDGHNRGRLPSHGKLVYLSVKGTQVLNVELTEEDIALFENELFSTYQQIVECEDYSGCHEDPETSDRDKMHCGWCAFHYLKRDAAQLVSDEVEELDDV